MWPQVPEDINSLSGDEANALSKAIAREAAARFRAGVDAEGQAEVEAHLTVKASLDARFAALTRAAALEAEGAETPAPEVPAAPETPVVTEAAVVPPAAPAVVTPAAPEAPVPTTLGTPTIPATTPAAPVIRTAPEYLFATSGVQGKEPGDAFESWAEMASAAIARGKALSPSSSERFEIARIRGNYSPEFVLGDDVMLNAARFEPSELTAALCAPATPHYNLACANVLDRPVFASLPSFQAPRGQVSIMSSPSLSDITGGYGQWTADDDADVNALKDECATIECGSPTTYKMYGVYRCLTVKNMLAMTYPELVEAYLNRLGAAQARLAEELMLNAMATGSTNLAAPALGYGASVTITSTILNYLALYQETERWTIPGNMEAWLPRWVMWGMKMDILRRRRTDGTVTVPSDAQINAMFANVGVNPHWYLDTPTYAVAIPSVGVNTLNLLPQSVQILIAPPGKFAAIDRGELAIGVTGNNIYRDNESNRRNQFTFFFENFEGIVNTTSCPAHILDIPVCWSGVQIDDIVINCQGGDEVGYQS